MVAFRQKEGVRAEFFKKSTLAPASDVKNPASHRRVLCFQVMEARVTVANFHAAYRSLESAL